MSRRLAGLGLLVTSVGIYLFVAHLTRLTCDRDAGNCVLKMERPLRPARVQTFPLSEILGIGHKHARDFESPGAPEILRSATGPFDVTRRDLWVRIGRTGSGTCVVILTRTGIVPVSGYYSGRDQPLDELQKVVHGTAARAEHVEGGYWYWMMPSLVPLLPALILLFGSKD